jgi:hypothetical protein
MATYTDWLRVSCTVHPLSTVPGVSPPPVAVVPDTALVQHSWDIVIADMPQRLGATCSGATSDVHSRGLAADPNHICHGICPEPRGSVSHQKALVKVPVDH